MYVDETTGELLYYRTPIKTPFLRTAYNYDMNAASDESALKCEDPTRAQQQFIEECDINTIVERFGLTGELPSNVKVPLTGDYHNHVDDFQSAMNIVREAQEGFMQLSANVRARFHNDPQELMTFVQDPENYAEAVRMGIAMPRAPEAPKEPGATSQAQKETP